MKKLTTVISPQTKIKRLTLAQRIQQLNEQLKQEGQFDQEPLMPKGSVQVMFFRKTPKYPKKIGK